MANLLSKITTPDNTPYILKDSTLTAGTCINISAHNATTGERTITNTGVRAVSTGGKNGTISVNTNGTSADVEVKGLGSAAYTSSEDYATADHKHDYLPLGGGTLSGNVNRYYSAASTDPMFKLVSNNQDVIFFDVGHGTSAAATLSSNYQLKYVGTGTNPNNLLVLTGKNGDTVTEILKTNQTGTSASFIGNSATATNFKDDTTVTLTGVVTGEATSKRGWSITTTIPDGKITNAMLFGSIANGKLANSKVTIAGKAVSLGGSLSAADLTTALGLSAAMKYKGSLTTLPAATSEDTYGAYNAGDVVTISSSGKEYVYNKGTNAAGSSWVELGDESSYKKKQTAVDDPGSSGTSTTFIKTISQNTNGDITATKAGLPTASTTAKGIMQVGTGLSVSSGTVSVSYGTAAGTACQGNDSRLTNARTPTSHTHGNITNGGAITTEEKIAEGDKLVIVDASDSSKLTGSTITFAANGSKFLRDDGTWQSVITAHQTYTSFTGKPTANATPSFGGTFTIQQISQSTTGQVSGTDRTVKIPALPVASTSTAGIIKIGTTKDDAAAGNHNHDSRYVNVSGDTMTGTLNIQPATGEGGELHLCAATEETTEAGIALDHYGSSLRIFGIASADGTTKTGTGTPLVIDPYAKTITGGYAITGSLNGKASTAEEADKATTATKLSNTSKVGNTDRPVYFTSGGVPAQTTYRMAATNATATTSVAITGDLQTGIWYVSGTNSTDLYSQDDGVAYVNQYNASWIHEIYGDYRTGHIAVRGKNNGTWKSWYKVLDSGNYTDFTVKKDGTGATGDWDIDIKGNAASATKATQDSAGNTISTTFLKLAGGTMTGDLSFAKVTSTEYPASSKAIRWTGDNDAAAIYYRQSGSNAGDLILETSDDSNERIIFRHTKVGSTGLNDGVIVTPYAATVTPSVTNKGSVGTSSLKWSAMYATKFYGDLDGNASTATSATSADKATKDASGNTITTTYLTKAAGVTAVTWDATNKKLTKTINGTTSDVATGAQIKAGLGLAKGDVGLGNVTNDAQIPKSIGTAKGDIIYWSDANEPARLAAGSNGQVLKINSSGLPVWTSDTDTHYTTHMYVNATSGGATSNAATANTTTYLHLYDNTSKRHTIQFKGAGGTSVAADANGVITITGATNTDTKVTQSVLANTTNKKYGILASYYETSAATTTAQTVNRDSKVYLNPFTSSIAAKEYIWHDNAATPVEKAYTIWNAADSSIDFIFI